MRDQPITMFTWGYWGWGNATDHLIKAVDRVEKARAGAFSPPLFVDVRLRRSGRAPGFSGDAFERTLGADRYRWMPQLGNKRIETGTGEAIQIAESAAAGDLLDLALHAAKHHQRIIFFCACGIPAHCHRAVVAKLVTDEARKRGSEVEIIEWPGGKPETQNLTIASELLAKVSRGRRSIPLYGEKDVARFVGLPWYSHVHLTAGEETLDRFCGPAEYNTKKKEWQLMALDVADAAPKLRAECITKSRLDGGYEVVS